MFYIIDTSLSDELQKPEQLSGSRLDETQDLEKTGRFKLCCAKGNPFDLKHY